MFVVALLIVGVAQVSLSVFVYRPGTLEHLGVRGTSGDILFMLPSIAAFAVDAVVIFSSSFLRSYRLSARLLLVIGFAGILTLLVFWLLLIIVLNRWGS
jgi:hypothetical protein